MKRERETWRSFSACMNTFFISWMDLCTICIRQHPSAYASIRQHTPESVSIRQHPSAYASIRQHTQASHLCDGLVHQGSLKALIRLS